MWGFWAKLYGNIGIKPKQFCPQIRTFLSIIPDVMISLLRDFNTLEMSLLGAWLPFAGQMASVEQESDMGTSNPTLIPSPNLQEFLNLELKVPERRNNGD